jgi:ferric-dicitrate binding protein FerR (iron transport regulator)
MMPSKKIKKKYKKVMRFLNVLFLYTEKRRNIQLTDYHLYTARDFALDEDFQNWVLHPNVKNNFFWRKWIEENPQKEAVINEAIALVHSITYRSYSLSDKEKDQLLESVWDKIGKIEMEIPPEEIKHITRKKRVNKLWRYGYAVAAAIFAGIIISVLWLSVNRSSNVPSSFSAYTGFGEVKKLILPDSSEVILNANSRLIYSEKSNKEREVWMEGEAYFHVKHTQDNKKFIVRTFDKLSVEVLGTSFNLNSRGDAIDVVLQHGSIKLEIEEPSNNTKTQLYLKPGEMVSYSKKKGDYMKKEVDAEKFNSWANGVLKMDNYSLEDAISFIKQTFGKNVVINDNSLLTNKISGSMPIIYNLDTMIIQFGKVFNVHFHKKGDDIVIQK